MRNIFIALLVAACSFAASGQDAAAPFKLTLTLEGAPATRTGSSYVVKTGTELYLNIQKTNTSEHELGCMRVTNYLTGLDPAYEFDVRFSNGNSVGKERTVDEGAMIGAFHGLDCKFKPGESSTSGGNEITRLYDLSQPGDYTIQVSQSVSNEPGAERIESNTITVTVTDDDAVIETARVPFKLEINACSDGNFGTTDGGLVVKSGAVVGINISKTNTSLHQDEDCVIVENVMTALDEKYQYDIRNSNGNAVGKRAITRPEPYMIPATACTIKPGESQGSSATISKLYDLSQPGKYTIQVSQFVSRSTDDGVVKSNITKVTVTP